MRHHTTTLKTAAAVFSTLIFLFAAGCGKKTPLVPPTPIEKGNLIASPTNLKVSVTENQMMLKWDHRIDPENAKVEPDAFEVFLAKKTFEECEGCPFVFKLAATIPVPEMTFSMPVEKGFQYYFRIQAVNEDNLRSDYSETVQYGNK